MRFNSLICKMEWQLSSLTTVVKMSWNTVCKSFRWSFAYLNMCVCVFSFSLLIFPLKFFLYFLWLFIFLLHETFCFIFTYSLMLFLFKIQIWTASLYDFSSFWKKFKTFLSRQVYWKRFPQFLFVWRSLYSSFYLKGWFGMLQNYRLVGFFSQCYKYFTLLTV